MAWKIVSTTVNDKNISSITIIDVQGQRINKETGLLEDYGPTYSARINAGQTGWKQKLLKMLKDRVNTDRAKVAKEDSLKTKIDLTNFEAYLSQ